MKYLNDILQELGISKVRLAKYLGVSRQMVYNYLELPNLSKWPKEKKISLLKLLDSIFSTFAIASKSASLKLPESGRVIFFPVSRLRKNKVRP